MKYVEWALVVLFAASVVGLVIYTRSRKPLERDEDYGD